MMDEMPKNESPAAVAPAEAGASPSPAAPQPPLEHGALEAMVRAGVLFGRKSSRTHPRMRRFIEMTRNGIELFDHVKALAALEAAGTFLERVVAARGTILCVGTTPAARDLLAKFADEVRFPRVTERWLGGTLTNFRTIAKRLAYYQKLKADYEAGRLAQYSKKERVEFSKEIDRMRRLFTGLEALAALPQALFVVNVNAHLTAIREARRLRIPIVAVMSSDADPDFIDYPIPGNDGSRAALVWTLERLKEYVSRGRAAAAAAPAGNAAPSSAAPSPHAP